MNHNEEMLEDTKEILEENETFEEDFTIESLNMKKTLLFRTRLGLILLILYFIFRRFDAYNAFNPINGTAFTIIGLLIVIYCIVVLFIDSSIREHEYKQHIVFTRLRGLNSIYDYMSVVPFVMIIFTLVNMFLFSFSPISGSSMEPNFSDDEAVVFSHLFTNYNRYDVVIVYVQEFDDPYLIKRIIGLPNETVTIDHNVISITDKDGNSFELNQDFINTLEIETLCYSSPDSNYCSWTLGEDEYIVLGDNRDGSAAPDGYGGSSLDSRRFGEVPVDDIYGKVIFKFKDFNLLK